MQAPAMIKCPRCGQSLMAQAVRCQFCGDDLQAAVRPVAVKAAPAAKTMPGAPSWVWPVYTALCVYYMIGGGLTITQTLMDTKKVDPIFKEPQGFTAFTYFLLVFGAIQILFGALLLARVEWVREMVNVFAGLSILMTLIRLPATILMALSTHFGMLALANSVLTLVTNAFMIYLLAETDKNTW